VIDEAVRTFEGAASDTSFTDRVLSEKDSLPLKYLLWKKSPDGELLHLREHLVRDVIEFVHRHELLVERFGEGKPEPMVLFKWLAMFALPLLVLNLVEYQRTGADIERGMPRGKFWYLPEPMLTNGVEKKVRIKWPHQRGVGVVAGPSGLSARIPRARVVFARTSTRRSSSR
jgi:hypothetical protein